ncbi:MAG: amino acid adenylation domain-containing protein, partial [Chloroflexota bacterium]
MKIKYGDIVGLISARSKSKKSITFISNNGIETRVGYGELIAQSLNLAAELKAAGFTPGDEVIFQFSENKPFVVALWACFLSGIVPVIVNPAKDSESARKLANVINTLNRPAALFDEATYRAINVYAEDLILESRFDKLHIVKENSAVPKDFEIIATKSSATAFIQFSSGSTGEPKGAKVSHKNLISNVASMLEAMDCDADEIFLSWAPLTHSSGMILSLANALAGDFDLYLMDKRAFIADPLSWLEKANEARASLIFSPNFGYKYLLDALDPQKDYAWDLSCVKHIMNGSEQISAALAEQFNSALSKYKLSPNAMTAIYGLAESTLAVSVGDRNKGLESVFVDRNTLAVGDRVEVYERSDKDSSIELVKLGRPVPGTALRITNTNCEELPEGCVGALQIKSDSVVAGYVNDEEASKALITADGWLNTGDLAFLHEGELVVVGKTKEVITVNGINHYPVDLERIAADAVGYDFSKIVASSYYDGEKQKEITVLGCVYRGAAADFYPIAERMRSEVLRRAGIEIDFIFPIEEIPKNNSGKVQRRLFAEKCKNSEYTPAIEELSSSEGKNGIIFDKRSIPSVVGKTAEEMLGKKIDRVKGLIEQGFNSMMAVAFRKKLSDIFELDLPLSLVFDYVNIEEISGFILSELNNNPGSNLRKKISNSDDAREPIAIIGIGLRFPGNVEDVETFWDRLAEGHDFIGQIPGSRWTSDDYDAQARKEVIDSIPPYGAYIEDVEKFDNRFFGISPKEAISLDPQQRLLLEVSYRAFEDAGIKISDVFGSDAGIFIGIANSDYLQSEVKSGKIEDVNIYSLTGAAPCAAAGRLSYFYGFHGPSIAIDTACSSSFAALHTGVKSLQNGETNLALVGGVNLILTPEFHIGLNEMGVLSTDGRCKVFDDSANGYVRSEGCAVLILKRLSEAMKGGDKIHGVILGSAINHDGRSAGLAAPNGIAQVDVMEKALASAQLTPADIDYFEAHGTGTAIGDVQEVNSISRVYGRRSESLLLGSVKSNVGHLEACSGLAGLIKVLASFKKRVIPGNLHFNAPNSNIPWNDIKLQVVGRNTSLPKNTKLRASINSFGFSGTNVNVIVGEAPERVENKKDRELNHTLLTHYALPISAQTPASLKELSKAYIGALSEDNFTDIVAGACGRRSDLAERAVAIGRNSYEIKSNLRHFIDGISAIGLRTASLDASSAPKDIVFQFSGGGSQRARMGRELYELSPVFKESFDECAKEFEKHTNISILDLLFSEDPLSENLEYAHPYLFAFEYSLAKLWMSWGVIPSAVVGHSIGEYAAACIAGILSLPDACKLVAHRARLMESVNGNGLMCAVFADENTVKKHLNGNAQKVDAAVINSNENIVLSGEKESLLIIIENLQRNNIETKILKVSLASHSRMMQPILDEYEKIVAGVDLHEPRCVYMSNMTGEPVREGEATTPRYWANQIRSCVRFGDSLNRLIEDGYRIYLEIGPSPVLSGIGVQAYPDLEALWLPSLDKTTTEWEQLLICAAELYAHHYPLNWNKILTLEKNPDIELPKYPFDRHAFWKDPLLRIGALEGRINMSNLKLNNTIESRDNGIMKIDVLGELKNMIFELTGNRLAGTDSDKLIFQLGLDSLIIVKLRQGIKRKFDVEIGMSKIFKELNSLRKISSHIESVSNKLTMKTIECETAVEANDSPLNQNISFNAEDSLLAGIFKEQFNIMNRQLDLLKSGRSSVTIHPAPAQPERKKSSRPAPVNFRSVKLDSDDTLSQPQRRYIDNLISAFNQKTKKSKEYAQKYRFPLCDWINTLSYRHELKNMSYPFVSERAEGCRITDIDGNEYIDLANGYGVHFFGHKPKFIIDAINREISAGMPLGPQSKIVGEAAELLCSITGNERATFCNTGTEAVMVAIRLARAKTGRDKIVIFSGSYHGTSDGVLAVADENSEIHPVSSGVPENMIQDVYVLEYGSDKALDFINERGAELAAVICEPVQSRKPELQPREFLNKLREITLKKGAALIFDEIVTGFRISPGGCQEHFGVRADIATYGKIAGGGMPIGIVSGKAEYLDMIDGGAWSFDDESAPSSDITFFGGTFCKHPITMAACNAVMKKIKSEGAALYEGINSLTADFVGKLNSLFKREGVPFFCNHFASQFRIDGEGIYSNVLKPIELDLFFYSMINKGVYFWERKINFFSVEITPKETDYVLRAAEETLREMNAAGFFRNDGNTGACVLPSDSIAFRAASAQKRMFILGQYENGELAYHITIPFILNGKPDFDKLERAFRSVVERRDALRSAFYSKDGEFLQEVQSDVAFNLIRIERPSGEDIHETISKFIQPFDFARPPLMRAGYCRLEGEEYLLVLDVHHIIVDGVSLGILFDELSKFYNGETNFELPVSSSALAQSEEEYLRSEEYAESRRYLTGKFSGELPMFELPATGVRKSSHNFTGAQLHFSADKELTASLIALARELNVTLYSVLVGAFYIFLNRATNREDFIIGIPVSSRPDDGTFDGLIGMTANTIPLRRSPRNESSIHDFLRETQSEIIAANEHNRFPLDELISALGVARQADRNPLFDLLFVYENAESRELDLGGIPAKRFKYAKRTTMSDFVLEAIFEDDIINLSIEYDDNLFNSQIIETYSERYLNVLKSIIIEDKRICDIDVLPAKIREKLLSGLALPLASIDEESVPEAFAFAARRYLNKTAVICEGQTLTYGELDARANDIAEAILRKFNPQKGDIAAIYMERGIDLVAALLAALKCGMAYLPLNKDYPKERISYLINAGKPTFVIADEQIDWAENIVLIDENNISVKASNGTTNNNGQAMTLEDVRLDKSDLAYLYFTSGSTGEPKGVMINHGNLLSFKENFQKIWGISDNDIIYAITPLTFDISNLEILCSLLNGLTVVIGTDEEINNIDLFIETIEKNRVNTLQITPSRLSLMINEIGAGFINKLKTALVGGEEMPKSLHQALVGVNKVNIFNVYGPTETTIWSTSKKISSNSSSIGSPLVNESVYVLDRELNILPPYVAGEIFIGGAGVGDGYWENAQLTEKSFIPNPFVPGTLYKTGDLGRINADLELEFIGRNDDQVKINGLRIELNEIEAVADSFSGLEKSVCIVKKDGEAKILVLFFTGTDVDISELKAHLAERLPRYMVPNIIQRIDEIPLSSNGKVDRRALECIRTENCAIKEIMPARNESERAIVKALCEVLNVSEISTGSNFFEIGGDSIKAIQLVSNLFRAGKSLELKDVLRRPIISEMAGRLRDAGAQITAVESDELTPAQEAIYYACAGKKGSLYCEQLSFEIVGALNLKTYERAWREVISRHDIFDSNFVPDEFGEVKRVIKKREPLEIIYSESLGDIDRIKSNLLEHDLKRGFDLENDRLIRIYLTKTGEYSFITLVSFHHIILDGWSHGLIFHELRELYRSFEENAAMEPGDSFKFGEFTSWLEKRDKTADREFWTNYLNGYRIGSSLFEAGDSNKISECGFILQEVDTAALQEYAKKRGITLSSIITSAWGASLARVFNKTDVVFGVAFSGRQAPIPNIENGVGMFINTLPVRITLNKEKSADEIIRANHNNLIDINRHGFYSLDEIQSDCGIDATLIDHALVIENYKLTELRIADGLEVRNVQFNERTDFGLTIYITLSEQIEVKAAYYDSNSPVSITDLIDAFRCNLSVPVLESRFDLKNNSSNEIAAVASKLERKCDSIPRREEKRLNNSIQEQLKEIFTKILGKDNLRADSNFFECGGHSLKAIKLISAIYKRLGYKLEFNDILRYPTIESLARALTGMSNSREEIKPIAGRKEYYELSAAQKRLWLIDNKLGNSRAYNVCGNLLLEGDLDVDAFSKTMELLVERHGAFRSSFKKVDGEPKQFIEKSVSFKTSFIDLHNMSDPQEAARNYVRDNSITDFDLTQAPLLNVALLYLGDEGGRKRYVMFFKVHHIVFDGWSNEILLKEISEVYNSLAQGI